MLRRKMPGRCPVCDSPMNVTRLACEKCGTAIEGSFETCRFCQLTKEQKEFIEIFIVSRGNIKEVERVLGISYPTVRGRLEAVIEALGYRADSKAADDEEAAARRKSVLESLSRGEITAEQALKMLRS